MYLLEKTRYDRRTTAQTSRGAKQLAREQSKSSSSPGMEEKKTYDERNTNMLLNFLKLLAPQNYRGMISVSLMKVYLHVLETQDIKNEPNIGKDDFLVAFWIPFLEKVKTRHLRSASSVPTKLNREPILDVQVEKII